MRNLGMEDVRDLAELGVEAAKELLEELTFLSRRDVGDTLKLDPVTALGLIREMPDSFKAGDHVRSPWRVSVRSFKQWMKQQIAEADKYRRK